MDTMLIQLAQKVKEMREAQYSYSRLRTTSLADKAERLESEVDAMVKTILNPPSNQQELFK